MNELNDFFPEDVKEAANKIGNDWLKGEEFDGEGLVLQVVKPLEKVKSNNPKYGAQETDFLVKNDLLEVGETFRFTFMTPDGTERKFDTKSSPFFIGFKQCEELGVGDWVKITRTGKTTETRYEVVKVDAPESLPVQQTEEEIAPKDIPF
jgi:hypothetical protein